MRPCQRDEALANKIVRVKVCIGDLDVQRGNQLEQELSGYVHRSIYMSVLHAHIPSRKDEIHSLRRRQVEGSGRPLSSSRPLLSNREDFPCIANAGIHREDEVFSYAGDDQEPEEPNLTIIDVNIKGVLYTAKLAAHYFIRQNGTEVSEKQEDSSLVLIGSGAAFLDCPRGPQYSASKWAMRGIMHSLRRTAHFYGSRVNIISPW